MKIVLAGLVALIIAAPAPRQTPASSQIAGLVVTSSQPATPIRRALLTLWGSELPHAELAISGDDGRFVFRDLPPGRYTLTAGRAGYVRQYYGAKRPGATSGIPIVITAGQTADISIPMTRAGAISGTLLMPPGLPASMLRVHLLRATTGNGERRFQSDGGAYGVLSDGAFRVPRLTPGEYQLFVTAAGAIELQQTTPEMIRWASQSGDVMGGAVPPPPPPQLITFSPVFYPGTVRAAEAGTITVGAGDERDVTFTVPVVASARVSGRVVDTGGQPPPSFQVWLVDEGAPVPRLSLQPRMERDGRFSITGVTPGPYLLVARATAQGTPAVQMEVAGGHSVAHATNATLWAMETITVSGDLSDVVLRLQPGRSVTGRVTAATGSASNAPAARVTLSPVSEAFWNASAISVETDAEGRFEVPSVVPGRYRVSVTAIGADNASRWASLSAILAGRDVLDDGLDVPRDANPSPLTITMTDRPTELSGRVLDSASRPITEFAVVVFSTDAKNWRSSRRVAQTRPGSDGVFVFANLPPGEYFVCAVTDVDASQLSDSSFLEQLMPSAFRVTLAAGEKKRQDMRIGTAGR